MIGLPMSYGSVELAVDAELLDPSGRSLGRRELRGKADVVEWLYRPIPGSCLRKLPEAFDQVAPDLREFVAGSVSGS
jgi:hypothetical protein